MNALAFYVNDHGKNFCPNHIVKKSHVRSSDANRQHRLPLIAPMQKPPVNAPIALLRQIESEAQAIAVSMRSSGSKLAYIAACMGKSESYISLIRSGKRSVPAWFVRPFCIVTGTNLLQQYIDFQAALSVVAEGESERARINRLAGLLEAA